MRPINSLVVNNTELTYKRPVQTIYGIVTSNTKCINATVHCPKCLGLHIHTPGEKDGRMIVARQEIDAKWQRRMEREKGFISEQLLNSLDRDKRAEMVDNGWMKREVGDSC